MRYVISGTDKETGKAAELTIDAADVPSAAAVAGRKGIDVESIRRTGDPIAEVAPRVRGVQPSPPPAKTKPARRLWLGLVLAVGFITSPFYPDIPNWLGIIVLAMVALYFVPLMRRPMGKFLRVTSDRPYLRTLKLGSIVVLGAFFLLCASTGREVVRNMKESQARDEAERQALAAAQATATAKVTELIEQARTALSSGDVSTAIGFLDQAVRVEHAQNRGLAATLRQEVNNSEDAGWVLEALASAQDDEFEAFASGGPLPGTLDLGYPVLSDRVILLARPQLDAAVAKRVENKRLAAEAAEAERQRREEAAIAQRKAAEQKPALEKSQKEAAKAEIQNQLDQFMAVLNSAEPKLVESVSVNRNGDIWTAKITVKNIFHLRHKQLRTQDAQTMWEWWASIASPKDADKARISLVDHKGNEVGGSRLIAGSLIWVQDE